LLLLKYNGFERFSGFNAGIGLLCPADRDAVVLWRFNRYKLTLLINKQGNAKP
jgi:hypothetical protein